MSVNEPNDSEPLSQIFGPIRNPLRVDLLRSPAPSDGNDSDATDEGVIAPVRIGHLQRVYVLRSPSQSEEQDSDTSEDGSVAPLALGNQQNHSAVNPTEAGEGRNDHVNLDIDLISASALTGNEPGIPIRPSVIEIRGSSSNLQAIQNVNNEGAAAEQGPAPDYPEYSDGIIMMTSPRLEGYEDDEPMLDEVSNAPLEAIPTSDVVSHLHDVAGPSNRPDGIEASRLGDFTSEHHSVQDEDAIIPVVVNYPPMHSRMDTSGSTNQASSSQNIEQTAQAERGRPVEGNFAIQTSSTSGPSDESNPPSTKRPRLSGMFLVCSSLGVLMI